MVQPIALAVGYKLVGMIDKGQGEPLTKRIKGVRQSLSEQMGMLLPAISVRDDLALRPTQYAISLSGTVVATSEPKETRVFDGREYVLETALTADYGLVRAAVGDRHGNLVFRESARNFNPLAGMAGRITIAEVEELVEPGEILPESVHLPGVFVQRVVVVGTEGKKIEKRTTRPRTDRSDAPAAAGEEASP